MKPLRYTFFNTMRMSYVSLASSRWFGFQVQIVSLVFYTNKFNAFEGEIAMLCKWNFLIQNLRFWRLRCKRGAVLGNSRKYPYPTTDGFHVLTPPCLRKFQNALPPMPSEFHNRGPPLPFRISSFSGKYIFDLSNAYMNKRTWINASSGLWSSGARRQALLFSDKKNLPLVARL